MWIREHGRSESLEESGLQQEQGVQREKEEVEKVKEVTSVRGLAGTSPGSAHSASFLINFHPSPSLPANAPAQVVVGIAKFTPHVFAFTADWANMGQYVPSQISEPKRF